MTSITMPLRPIATLVVVFLILVAFAWAGRDETLQDRSCPRWAPSMAACRRF
jgi:hypothetical protein